MTGQTAQPGSKLHPIILDLMHHILPLFDHVWLDAVRDYASIAKLTFVPALRLVLLPSLR